MFLLTLEDSRFQGTWKPWVEISFQIQIQRSKRFTFLDELYQSNPFRERKVISFIILMTATASTVR